jgi:peptidoglycan/LPS O-acetylase OafA/YrhL
MESRRLRDAFSLAHNLRSLVASPPDRVQPLDGLRALSALWVWAFHALFLRAVFLPPEVMDSVFADPVFAVVLSGDLGVDVFFVMSAFLMAHLAEREHAATGALSFRRFWRRRAVRLFPAYLALLVLVCPIAFRAANCHNAWLNVLGLNNFVPIPSACVPWTWSLALELQFYLVFPLFFVGWRPRRALTRFLILGALVIVAVGIRGWIAARHGLTLPVPNYPTLDPVAYYGYFNVLYQGTHVRFGAFVIGLLAAHLHHERWSGVFVSRRPALARGAVLAAAAVAGLIAFTPIRDPAHRWTAAGALAYMTAFHYLFALAIASLVLLALEASGPGRPGWRIARILSSQVWLPVAQVSYSGYLLNPVVVLGVYLAVAPRAAGRAEIVAWVVGLVALTAVAGTLLYLLVERPSATLLGRRRSGAPTGAAHRPLSTHAAAG